MTDSKQGDETIGLDVQLDQKQGTETEVGSYPVVTCSGYNPPLV